jgi:hypothetical protein
MRIGYFAEKTNIPVEPVTINSAAKSVTYIKVVKENNCPCKKDDCVLLEVGVDDKK